MKYIYGILFCVLIGCKTGSVEPDPTPPPTPPPVTKFIIEASVVGTGGTVSPAKVEVVKGGSVDFLITPQIGYDPAYITVNGVKSPLTSTTYSFIPSANSKLEFELKKNNLGFLIEKPWKGLQQRKRDVGTIEWGQISSYGFSLIFDNQRFQTFNSITTLNATTLVGNGNYILTKDSLIIGPNPQGGDGIRNKIITLTRDSLVLRYISKFFGSPKLPDTEIEDRFIH